jgi:adenine-specific DNA-methyltransferase
VQPDKGVGPPDLAGNLVIHGDNLHALKSLLPRYAGQVDLVFIDPPYNTGNEGWCYSDNVNSPIMKEWLSTNPVDGEDLLRHDKWLCMMWPRLVLLRELLSERGSLWMTLDDNEVHRARMVMDEIFGEEASSRMCIWQKNYSPKNTAQFFQRRPRLPAGRTKACASFGGRISCRAPTKWRLATSNPDNDPRGPWTCKRSRRAQLYGERPYSINAERVA